MDRAAMKTNWTVTIHATNGELVGCGISLHQCPECFALVVEDFMPEHQDWHAEQEYDRNGTFVDEH